jgi:ribosomal peptide maturation radical SAM protein 1
MTDVAPSSLAEERLLSLISSIGRGHDCVIIVPPFASVARPALGPHILQAIAQREGMYVAILYSNLIFADMVGVEIYERACDKTNRAWLIGERIFARVAHGLPRLGLKTGFTLSPSDLGAPPQDPFLLSSEKIADISSLPVGMIEKETDRFCSLIALGFSASACRIFGATTSFEQTNAAVAILRSIKQQQPTVVTLMGGANCEGPMAPAVLELASGSVDFVFAGESEGTFPELLKKIIQGEPLHGKVVEGIPCHRLDDIPPPNFSNYFDQLSEILPAVDPGGCWLTYESSRGCWWGQKHHCTFCGLNGEGMVFRQKSPSKVLSEIKRLFSEYPTKQLAMTDNIMPHTYHNNLIPQLAGCDGIIFYEQKSNMTLDQVRNLREGGVAVIQPGIEALSTPLLKLMKKGVSASQNIALLRYARSSNVSLAWNLLTEFPGDSVTSYQETLSMLPALRHLNPPTGVSPLSIDRFSPYFYQTAQYGISKLRPWSAYCEVFPDRANIPLLAYHFEADYESGSRNEPQLLTELRDEVESWRQSWVGDDARPVLAVSHISGDTYLLIDTREMERPRIRFLSQNQARSVLVEGPLSGTASGWAIDNGYALNLDGKRVPLAIASYELMREFASATGRERLI